MWVALNPLHRKPSKKTQKFNYFWVFSIDLCTKVLFIDSKISSSHLSPAQHLRILQVIDFIEFLYFAQFASNPSKALFFKALRGVMSSFQQSYPQFLGTASKDHEKQQLIGVFKKFYELHAVKIDVFNVSANPSELLNAKVA